MQQFFGALRPFADRDGRNTEHIRDFLRGKLLQIAQKQNVLVFFRQSGDRFHKGIILNMRKEIYVYRFGIVFQNGDMFGFCFVFSVKIDCSIACNDNDISFDFLDTEERDKGKI